MKDVEENCTNIEQGTPIEKKSVSSNHPYHTGVIADENCSTWNGGGEPCSKQDSKRQGQVSSERGKGRVASDIHEKALDDGRFGRRSAEGSRHSNKTKANRRLYNDGRKPAERHLVRGGRKRKYFEDRDEDHLQSEDNLSEDDELAEHSRSDMSEASRSHSPTHASIENMRSNNWSWKTRYHDTRYHDERLRKTAKRRSFHRTSYERELPDYNPLIREMGRFYQMHSPVSSLELRFDEMISQLLHRQDLMLMKLDTIVTLLHKTVKVLTSPQNQAQTGLSSEKDSSVLEEHEMRSSARRYREHLSDTEAQGDYTRCRESNKARYMQYTSSSEKERKSKVNNEQRGVRGFYGSQGVGTDTVPEMMRSVSHDGVRVEVNDHLPPRISSYYSVRRNSAELFRPEQYCGEEMEEEGGRERRIIATNGTGKSSSFGQPIKRRSWGEYGTVTAEEENEVGREKSGIANGIGADKKLQLKESTSEPITNASERHFVDESDRVAYAASTEYIEDSTQANDSQRSLNVNERPSMVDLSHTTSNIILPKKFYASNADAIAGSSGGVEVVDTRDLPVYEEGTVPGVYTRQGWQSTKTMDAFLQPSSYRKRDSSEYRTWLARTFTTGSGHSEDFPRSMVTKGHEARNANHNGAKSSLTDNKKMMSNIAHLIMSSIDVSSEIVQILVATPSDNNSNKDHSRKSMECLLNQSLAIMGCLPLIAEIDLSVVQKIYQSSKNCMSFIYRLMDHCYAREELMRCRVAGGVRRYRGNNTETEQLCPKRLRTVLKLASDLFPNEYIKLSKANMIRNNINMKCRKTVIRDIVN